MQREQFDFYSQTKMVPMKATGSISIAISSSDTATINVPDGETWFIKSITITKGASITVSGSTVDGENANTTASVSDTVAKYGALLVARENVTVSGNNASTTAAETLEITVEGFKITQ
jgi:hypothetical protein